MGGFIKCIINLVSLFLDGGIILKCITSKWGKKVVRIRVAQQRASGGVS
jgi:hypothetical protein